jgi:hypothetical protein
MTYAALVSACAAEEDLPVPVQAVIDWIRAHTDHNTINLRPVGRKRSAFRGAFVRRAVPILRPYSADYDIVTDVLFAEDLSDDWKRLVIVKEVLHVFDHEGACVNTEEGVRRLIPAVLANELQVPFLPALNDHLGAFRAMAVLIPRAARQKLRAAFEDESRTVGEIAHYAQLPDYYVDIWLRYGEEIERLLGLLAEPPRVRAVGGQRGG